MGVSTQARCVFILLILNIGGGERKKLPSVDGTDGSEGMMEKRSGAASSWMRLLLLF